MIDGWPARKIDPRTCCMSSRASSSSRDSVLSQLAHVQYSVFIGPLRGRPRLRQTKSVNIRHFVPFFPFSCSSRLHATLRGVPASVCPSSHSVLKRNTAVCGRHESPCASPERICWRRGGLAAGPRQSAQRGEGNRNKESVPLPAHEKRAIPSPPLGGGGGGAGACRHRRRTAAQPLIL